MSRELRRALKNEKELSGYHKIMSDYSIEKFESMLKDVISMHDIRVAQKLWQLSTPGQIRRAGLRGQSYRSRCVALMLNVVGARNKVAEALEVADACIRTKYRTQINESGSKTIADKTNLLKDLFKDAHSLIYSLDSIEEQIELVITDIDKSAWTLSSSLKSLELEMSREKF